MVLSPHYLIVACSLALASLIPAGSACGQIYGQQVSTNSASTQGYNSGAIVDHSSMSPDSWSAPATLGAPVASVASSIVPSRFQQSRSSPSIPDLNAAATRQPANRIQSLIRQPGIGAGNSVLPSAPNNASQTPFKSARYRLRGQDGLSLTSPDQSALSNTSLPAFRNQPSLPQEITSATGKFDIDSASNPVIPNLPAASSSLASPATFPVTSSPAFSPVTSSPATLSPATLSPVFGQPTLQRSTGRYPLGINGGLPSAAPTIQALPGSPTTSYQALTTETQLGSPSYPNFEVSGPAISQPLFQQQQSFAGSPVFRPDLGHRDPGPTFRGRDRDSGLKMDFEDKKKEYPGIGEILATGRYFGSASALFLQPAFQNNSAITQFNSSTGAASFVSSESFDFDYETAPRLRLGFESKFGPGVELDYFQFDQGSNISSFTSNGLNSGQLSTGLFGPSGLTTLEAVNAGERLSAIHSIDVETFSIMFFKEIKFPISRLNGMFGFQYASIFQELEGELADASGAVIGSLRSTSDLRAYGPKFKFEYYRPIGHTNLEFVTAFGGGVLFGERDQIVSNTGSPAVNRFGADEFVLIGDFYGGVQWKKLTAENRAYYVRLGVTHQSWVGGGTAVNSQDNFGLRGFSFEVGLNR